ncbi:MAG: four helix bundle protein [Chloroflexota bacterium]|nr:four helix bundle protein [Chloroflexota bacterium]
MEEPRTENQEPRAKGPYSFRNLILWQKAQELALAVIKVLATLPRGDAAQIIARQLVASAGSIGANVAEGHGRFSLAAHRNHLSIAKGSACETDGWLYLLRRAGYLDPDIERGLHQDCQEIIRMLTAKILDLERRENRRGLATLRENSSPYEAADYLPDDQVLGSGF